MQLDGFDDPTKVILVAAQSVAVDVVVDLTIIVTVGPEVFLAETLRRGATATTEARWFRRPDTLQTVGRAVLASAGDVDVAVPFAVGRAAASQPVAKERFERGHGERDDGRANFRRRPGGDGGVVPCCIHLSHARYH